MYRIDATCRKHPKHHDSLVFLFRKHKWNFIVSNKICRISCIFESMSQAKESKKAIETDLQKLERQIKPDLGYGIIFSNVYWLDPKKAS